MLWAGLMEMHGESWLITSNACMQAPKDTQISTRLYMIIMQA